LTNGQLIETHCHLNDSEAFPDVSQALKRAHDAGIAACIVIGIDEDSSRKAVELSEAYSGLYCTVGWHPNHAQTWSDQSIIVLQELMQSQKVLAIGEIGLDYHWEYATREQQFRALNEQLDLAQKHQMRTVFHCREAYSDLLDLLEKRDWKEPLLHCFSGSLSDAQRAQELGAYFGIDGPITYKNAEVLREIVRTLPHDRLVLETDAPYLSPHPFRGKPNEPALLPLVNAGLAATLGLDAQACAQMTTANAQRFFGPRLKLDLPESNS